MDKTCVSKGEEIKVEIINSYDKRRKLIEDVSIGECFIYKDRLCMKVKPSIQEEYYNNKFVDFNKNEINAITDSTEVVVIDAKIVVEWE